MLQLTVALEVPKLDMLGDCFVMDLVALGRMVSLILVTVFEPEVISTDLDALREMVSDCLVIDLLTVKVSDVL